MAGRIQIFAALIVFALAIVGLLALDARADGYTHDTPPCSQLPCETVLF